MEVTMADEIQNDIQLAVAMGDTLRLLELIELQEALHDDLDLNDAVEA
jgi:hypothetical protein